MNKLLLQTNYDPTETQFLVDGFSNGFSLNYQGPHNRQDISDNIPFTPGVGDERELWMKLMKEVKLKRLAGPFNHIPFDNYIQSPIGLVPKAGNQTRLIFHLSYKFKNGNESVNFWIPHELCTAKYRDLDHAVNNSLELIQEAKNKQVWKPETETGKILYYGKTDLKSAFRQMPLKKQMFFLLIMKAKNPVNGKTVFFVDKCLPFGASISCAHFQRLSNALRHIVQSLENLYNSITNYLDDFLFIHYIRSVCDKLIRRFTQICNQICLPISDEKTENAQEVIVFLGMLLNGRASTLMVPEDKRNKTLHILQYVCDRKKITIKEVEQLTGILNFLNRAIVPGCVFTRRMYSKLQNKSVSRSGKQLRHYHHISLDKEFKNDCRIWITFLLNQSAVNRPFVDFSHECQSQDLGFFTDSSKGETMGFGCFFNRQWTFGSWKPGFIKEMDPSIAYLELYAVCVGIFTWNKMLQNISILIHCDNISVVHMVNNMTSKCKNCMYLLRLLMLDNMLNNRKIMLQYIETKKNSLADVLSRQKIDLFLKIAPTGTKITPEPLPEEIWPVSKIWQK